MENSLTKDQFNQALCDVRKAHRLIFAYQQKMLDLTYFIKSKLGFPQFGGNKLFSNAIEKKRDSYDNLKIWRNMWAWDFLYSYVFEYYLGKITKQNIEMQMSIFQVSDTGYFDNDTHDSRTELETYANEESSVSKMIFVIERKNIKNKYAWSSDWIRKKVYNNHERMSSNHLCDCLKDNENIQVIYSFSLDRFLNENTTIEALQEFVDYCKNNGISELKLL